MMCIRRNLVQLGQEIWTITTTPKPTPTPTTNNGGRDAQPAIECHMQHGSSCRKQVRSHTAGMEYVRTLPGPKCRTGTAPHRPGMQKATLAAVRCRCGPNFRHDMTRHGASVMYPANRLLSYGGSSPSRQRYSHGRRHLHTDTWLVHVPTAFLIESRRRRLVVVRQFRAVAIGSYCSLALATSSNYYKACKRTTICSTRRAKHKWLLFIISDSCHLVAACFHQGHTSTFSHWPSTCPPGDCGFALPSPPVKV